MLIQRCLKLQQTLGNHRVTWREHLSGQQSRNAGLIGEGCPSQAIWRRIKSVITHRRKEQSRHGVVHDRCCRSRLACTARGERIVCPGLTGVDGSVEARVGVTGERAFHLAFWRCRHGRDYGAHTCRAEGHSRCAQAAERESAGVAARRGN